MPFLEQHPEVQHRIYAFRLKRILSGTFGEDLANKLNLVDKLALFKDKLLDNQSTDGERFDVVGIMTHYWNGDYTIGMVAILLKRWLPIGMVTILLEWWLYY